MGQPPPPASLGVCLHRPFSIAESMGSGIRPRGWVCCHKGYGAIIVWRRISCFLRCFHLALKSRRLWMPGLQSCYRCGCAYGSVLVLLCRGVCVFPRSVWCVVPPSPWAGDLDDEDLPKTVCSLIFFETKHDFVWSTCVCLEQTGIAPTAPEYGEMNAHRTRARVGSAVKFGCVIVNSHR